MDISQSQVTRQIGAVSMSESDTKFDESVFEFINSTWREYEEELYYDASSGELMIKELVEAARKVEMETYKKHGVYEKVPIEECWTETGKAPIGVKWVDTNKGDKERPEYRCRLVAKEIKKDKREDLFAATPPVEAKKMLFHCGPACPACAWILETWCVRTSTRKRGEGCTRSCQRRTLKKASVDF